MCVCVCVCVCVYVCIHIYTSPERVKLRVATAKNFVYFTSLFALLVWY